MSRPLATLRRGIPLAMLTLLATPGAHGQFGGLAGGPRTAGPDPEAVRTLESLQHELAILEAKAAIKRAEIAKIQAEIHLKALESTSPRPGPAGDRGRASSSRTAPGREPLTALSPVEEALRKSIPMPFPDPTPLDDVLSYLKSATRSPSLPEGLTFVFDPENPRKAGELLDVKVRLKSDAIRVTQALREVLDPLRLGHVVRGDEVVITARSEDGAIICFTPNRRPPNPAKEEAKRQAILEALKRPCRLSFPTESPLEDVLKGIQQATVSKALPDGIPLYVDPAGLDESGRSETTPVKLERDGLPLGDALRLLLEPIGLEYYVSSGLLTITSKPSAEVARPK